MRRDQKEKMLKSVCLVLTGEHLIIFNNRNSLWRKRTRCSKSPPPSTWNISTGYTCASSLIAPPADSSLLCPPQHGCLQVTEEEKPPQVSGGGTKGGVIKWEQGESSYLGWVIFLWLWFVFLFLSSPARLFGFPCPFVFVALWTLCFLVCFSRLITVFFVACITSVCMATCYMESLPRITTPHPWVWPQKPGLRIRHQPQETFYCKTRFLSDSESIQVL